MSRQSILLVLTVILNLVWSASLLAQKAAKDEAAYSSGGKIQCGKLTCPQSASGCTLRKKNSPDDPSTVDVTRRCVDKNGATVLETEDHFKAKKGEYYDTYAQTGSDGSGSGFSFDQPGFGGGFDFGQLNNFGQPDNSGDYNFGYSGNGGGFGFGYGGNNDN